MTAKCSRRQLEAICNHSSVGFFLLDEHQLCTYANPTALAISGYTLAELEGESIYKLIRGARPHSSPGSAGNSLILRAVAENCRETGEEVFVRKNGELYNVAFTASPIRDDRNIVGTVLEVQEITEQKRKEAHLVFLADVSKDLSRLCSAAEILETAGEKVGKHLKVQTCSFHDINDAEGRLALAYRWRSARTSQQLGTSRINDYVSEECRRASRVGETVVIRDTGTDRRTHAQGFASLDIHSFIAVPLLRHGQWRYLFSVTDSRPRDWSPDEVDVVQEFANRVFPSLERARTEEALREREARYRGLFEAIHQGFGVLEMIPDADGNLIDFCWLETNSAFSKHTGFVATEGRPVSELVPGLEHHWAEIYGRIAVTGKAERFVEHSDVLGRSFEVEAFRIGRPDQNRVAVLFNDITERRRFEQALQESEARYRNLFSSMSEGFCVLEKINQKGGQPPDFRFVEANAAFAVQSGLGEVLGKSISEITPNYAAMWNATYDQVLRSGKAFRFEGPLESQGRILEVYAYRVEDHQLDRVAVIFSDITAHKQTEQALRTADRRKDEFLAILAHELRNPLGAVRNTVKLLEENASDPVSRRFLHILDRQSSKLNGLVNDLLDVSRVTRGLVALKLQKVDLGQKVELAVESTQSLIDEKRHKLHVSLPDEHLIVMGDPLRLEQVVTNLLTNSAKYTDAGGTIEIILRRKGNSAELRVRDNGIGMTPEVIEQVFDLFGQADRGLARSEGGLGIGLTIVKNLVELHGGQIEARSEGIDRGSEFTVTLPLTADKQDEPAPAGNTTQSVAAAKRVLIVEDNQDVANTLALLLEHAGHQVAIVQEGSGALSVAKQFKPEVILLDIGLPEMDGYEVARRLRQDPITQNSVIAAITGYGQQSDIERAYAAGFDKHFTKPVDLEALTNFVLQPRR